MWSEVNTGMGWKENHSAKAECEGKGQQGHSLRLLSLWWWRRPVDAAGPLLRPKLGKNERGRRAVVIHPLIGSRVFAWRNVKQQPEVYKTLGVTERKRAIYTLHNKHTKSQTDGFRRSAAAGWSEWRQHCIPPSTRQILTKINIHTQTLLIEPGSFVTLIIGRIRNVTTERCQC